MNFDKAFAKIYGSWQERDAVQVQADLRASSAAVAGHTDFGLLGISFRRAAVSSRITR